jgi:hypothetical protein
VLDNSLYSHILEAMCNLIIFIAVFTDWLPFLFFSRVFLMSLYANDPSTVLERSYYQLYHTATFDSLDRTQLILLIMVYRNIDKICLKTR